MRALRAALLGHPVAHSLSPILHGAAGLSVGLDVIYELVDLPPEQLANGVRTLVERGFHGFNLTAPHKRAIIPLLDQQTDAAIAAAAVNTVRIEGSRLVGHNTDVEGLAHMVASMTMGRVVLVGAGGAARAVACALAACKAPFPVQVYNRSPEAAHEVAALVGGQAYPLDALAEGLRGTQTVILALPEPLPSTSLPLKQMCRNGQVIDLNYGARAAANRAAAQNANLGFTDGLGMLIHQGIAAFQWWTGHAPSADAVVAAVSAAVPRAH